MNITVYCSSRSGLDAAYDSCAAAIGAWIARNGHTLVYGGIGKGDMKILARACRDNGGPVIGIVPSSRRSAAWEGNDENLLTDSLNQRKDILINLGERFVALPGGYGTMDEILSTLSEMMFTLTPQSKRLLIVNIGGIFDSLLYQLDVMVNAGLMSAEIYDRFTVVASEEEALAILPEFCK